MFTLAPSAEGIPVFAMEIGPTGEYRQRLVGGVTAQIGSQINGMRTVGQKFEVGAVGAVHQKGDSEPMGGRRQRGDIRRVPQIVRRGDIHRRGRTGQGPENTFQLYVGHVAPAQGERGFLRPQPDNLRVQQSRR